MLVFSSLSFWLREAGVERSTIGFFSWVTLAYAFKWLWAPAVDQLSIPILTKYLGRRKSWLYVCQLALVVAILAMAFTDPLQHLYYMAIAAVAVAFLSATQDILIDAFRIESGTNRQQAAMAASYMIGYRLAMIVATAGVLYLTAMSETWFTTKSTNYTYLAWQFSYLCMAGLMLGLSFITLFSPEPKANNESQGTANENLEPSQTIAIQSHGNAAILAIKKIKAGFIDPVIDLVTRYRTHALLLIILIATYRISDVVMGVMANVFYVDMGYSKEEIATVSKVFGVLMTLVGAFVAGGLINRFGILPILLIGALLSALTNLLFVALSITGHNLNMLVMVISVDNLSAGIAMAALIAFLSSLTKREFTATQYAWLSSAMILLPKSVGGFSGVMLEQLGYTWFFSTTALIGLPAIVCLLILIKQKWHA